MLDIVKMSEELRSKLQREADSLINDRLTMRDVLEARSRELADKRDAEISRIEAWATEQRQLVQEIFTALLQETEMDRMKNDESLQRMTGAHQAPEGIPPHIPAKSMPRGLREIRAAE
jgi:L-rhamnose isomerase